MSRRTALGAALVVAGAWAFAVFVGSATAGGPPAGPGVYVALGDSLGTGSGASVAAHTGYVPRLFASAHGQPFGGVRELVNLSRGGETAGTMIADGQLAAAVAAIADPATEARIVTIDIGGDDLLPLLQDPVCAGDPAGAACRAAVGGALASVASNLPVIIGTIQATLAGEGAGGRLFVMTYYNPFSGTGSPFEAAVDQAQLGADGVIDCAALANPANVGLNDLVACTAAQLGATVVDVYPAFAGRGDELTHIADGDIHPNSAGYAVIAHAFLEAIR